MKLGALLVVALLISFLPAGRAADHGKSQRAAAVVSSRFCTLSDLVGTWRLVKLVPRYQFKDPNAPYLLPHQVFQFAKNGEMKSAFSSSPFGRGSEKILRSMPARVTYGMEGKGMVVLKAKEAPGEAETWHCVAMTQNKTDHVHQTVLQQGDLVMTLVGPEGQPVLVRQLRKGKD